MARKDISEYISGLKKDESKSFQSNKDCYTIGRKYSNRKFSDNGVNDCFLVGETIPYESYICSTEMLFSEETKFLNQQLGIHTLNKKNT